MRELEDRDLLRKDDDGYYELTERGQSYLSGDIDADELE
ncbi:hypothetical protein [Halorubrum aquaticum]|nr:hypothetical protein [Halorubrum aquaticum]